MIIYSEKEQSPVSEKYTPNSLSNPIIPNYGLSLFILSKEQEKPEKSSTEEKDLFPTCPKIIDIGYDLFNLLDESVITFFYNKTHRNSLQKTQKNSMMVLITVFLLKISYPQGNQLKFQLKTIHRVSIIVCPL